MYSKSPFGTCLIILEFTQEYIYCFHFHVFYGIEIFGMRWISLGRGNQTEDHTALVLCLHTESDPQSRCVGILAVPGTGVVVPSLCLDTAQAADTRAEMKKQNDTRTSHSSSMEHQPTTGPYRYKTLQGLDYIDNSCSKNRGQVDEWRTKYEN